MEHIVWTQQIYRYLILLYVYLYDRPQKNGPLATKKITAKSYFPVSAINRRKVANSAISYPEMVHYFENVK